MKLLRVYKFRRFELCCEIRFLEDEMEYCWDTFGFGIERGKRKTDRQELSPDIENASGVFVLSGATKFYGWLCLCSGILIQLFVPSPWAYIGSIFLAAFVLFAIKLTYYFRKRIWINIYRNDGAIAARVQASDWTVQEREEFISYYKEWISARN